MRILDKSNLTYRLKDLGFGDDESRLMEIIRQPHGIILVTGPTGSGKTTTLYSALQEMSNVEVNTVTLEDPVEYKLPLIRQSQVNVKTGMTFALGLRSLLRQDPDIIMVGEVRDNETAQIAVEAALTGHIVLSTLHTNDAPGALPRMIDMGVEPFLLASSVSGIIAQRLVRRVCESCKTKFPAPESVLKVIGDGVRNVTLYRGKGCRACNSTGYKGRLGIYEVLTVNEEIRTLVTENATADKIRHAATKSGMKTLRQNGIQKALAGLTTMEEVLRVTVTAE